MEPDKIYPNIISVRNTEAILGWTRTSFYSAFIGGIFMFIVTRFAAGTFQHTVMCGAGLTLTAFWLLAAIRSKKLINYWNERLADLESADQDLSHPRVFAGKEFEKIDNRRIRNHRVLNWLIAGIALGWIALLMRSLCLTDWKPVQDFIERIWG